MASLFTRIRRLVGYILQWVWRRLPLPGFAGAPAAVQQKPNDIPEVWEQEKVTFLSLALSEKRNSYQCGHNYVTLQEVPAWTEYYNDNEVWLRKLSEGKLSDVNDVDADLNDRISIWRGDITKLEIHCIVNAANKTLLGGGGVDGVIHKAAGPHLVEECDTLNGCETGQSKITGGYCLPAKYVIHTVGPVGHGDELLTGCYLNSLNIMKDMGLRSIAFPCISTGIYGFPHEKAASIALKTARTFLEENRNEVDRIIFCLFLPVDVEIYERLMQKYFPVRPFDPRPQTEVVKSMDLPEVPVEDPSTPEETSEPTRTTTPTGETEKPVELTEKLMEEAEKSTTEAEKSATEAEKSTTEVEKSVEEIEKSTAETEKSTAETEKTTAETEKSIEEIEKSIEETGKSIAETENQITKIEKSEEETENSTSETEKPGEETEKPTTATENSIDETEKAMEETKKPTIETEKSEEIEKAMEEIEKPPTEKSVEEIEKPPTEKSVEEIENSAHEVEISVEETEKTPTETEKSTEETEKKTAIEMEIEETDKSTEEPIEETNEPMNQTEQPQEETEKPKEIPVPSVETERPSIYMQTEDIVPHTETKLDSPHNVAMTEDINVKDAEIPSNLDEEEVPMSKEVDSKEEDQLGVSEGVGVENSTEPSPVTNGEVDVEPSQVNTESQKMTTEGSEAEPEHKDLDNNDNKTQDSKHEADVQHSLAAPES